MPEIDQLAFEKAPSYLCVISPIMNDTVYTVTTRLERMHVFTHRTRTRVLAAALICTLILPATLQSFLDARPVFALTTELNSTNWIVTGVTGISTAIVLLINQIQYNNGKLGDVLTNNWINQQNIPPKIKNILLFLNKTDKKILPNLVQIIKKANCDQFKEQRKTMCHIQLQKDILIQLQKFFPKKAFRPECLNPEKRTLPKCENDRNVFGVPVPNQVKQRSKRPSSSVGTSLNRPDNEDQCEQATMLLNTIKHIRTVHEINGITTASLTENIPNVLRKNEHLLLWMVDRVYDDVLKNLPDKKRNAFMKEWEKWKVDNNYARLTDHEKAVSKWTYFYGLDVFQQYYNTLHDKDLARVNELGDLMEYIFDTQDIAYALQEQGEDIVTSKNKPQIIALSLEIPLITKMIDKKDCANAMNIIEEIIGNVPLLISYYEISSMYSRLTSPPQKIAKLYSRFPKPKRTLQESINRAKQTSAVLNKKFKTQKRRHVRPSR